MHLTSPAFSEGEKIPQKYTCEGTNERPPLEIHTPPKGTKSFVLILEDPDVPSFVREDNMYNHWVVFNIPPETTLLPEGTCPTGTQGKNTSGSLGYIGPCPPDREHRYFFRLYALGSLLHLQEGATKEEIQQAMVPYLLEECSLMGRYEKKRCR